MLSYVINVILCSQLNKIQNAINKKVNEREEGKNKRTRERTNDTCNSQIHIQALALHALHRENENDKTHS